MADSKRTALLLLDVQTKGAKTAAADIDKIAQEFAFIAKTSGSVGSSLRLAVGELERLGGTQDDVKRLTALFNQYRKEVEKTTDEVLDLAAAQKQAAGGAPSSGGSSSGGPSGSSRITRIGQEIRALPSQRISIGGTEIGTDSIGNLLRVSGAIAGVGEKAAETSKVAQFLTPILGQTAAGIASMAIAAAPYAVVFGAAALAIKSLTDEAQKGADAINKQVDAQRKGNEEILAGLTSDEAKKKIEELTAARKLEQDVLDQSTAAYAKFEQQTQAAVDSGENLAGTLTDIIFGQGATVAGAKAVNAQEDALNQQRETSVSKLADLDSQTAEYNALLESGALAMNDAAAALERLSDATIGQADAAGKELAAKQRADNADGEANQKRLDAIADEKAQIEAQLAVLEKSGLTTEDVTAKIAGLEAQLGALGVESSYITDVALEASKARDAEKTAAEDQEKALEDATRAAEQNAKAVDSAKTAYRNSVQDIGIRLSQTLQDSTTRLFRDQSALATKYADEQYDLQLKAGRAERNAYQDQLDDLADIREKAKKDEAQALKQGDFAALYEARNQGAAELQQEITDEERARRRRAQSQEDALQDLNRTNQRQRDALGLGYREREYDARLYQQRELQQAQLTQNRAFQIAAEGQNAELKQLGNYYAQRLKMDQQYQAASLNMRGASTSGANANSPFGAFQSQFKAVMSR